MEVVAEKLSSLGLECALRVEELDPQFQAIKLITSKMDFGTALTLIVLNSLVSYRLSGRGEDYWNEFAFYISKLNQPKSLIEAIKIVINFLSKSKINVALRSSKTSRLLRALTANILDPQKITEYAKDLRAFAKALASNLKSKWNSKTVVFSLKMICYAYRAYYEKPLTASFDIPIPIDSRIAKLSWTSGIVDIIDSNFKKWHDIVKVIVEKPREAQRAWGIVAEKCKIPPLHLDSILWFVGGFINRSNTRERAVGKASEILSRMISKNFNEVVEVVDELIIRYL